MARTARHRVRSNNQYGSVRVYDSTSLISSTPLTIQRISSCDDYIGTPVVDSPFSSIRYLGDGLGLNGSCEVDVYGQKRFYVFDGYPITLKLPAGMNNTPLLAKSGWYLDMVAGTNPSRPVMTPPTLLQDLVELPKQIFQLGKLFKKPRAAMTPKELSSHYLCLQFGWMPLFEDLRQLLDLQKLILKRNEELQKLYSGKGLRRRLRFDSETSNGSVDWTYILYGVGNTVVVSYDVIVKKRTWGTIHWQPTSPPPYHPNDARMNDRCRDLVLGLTIEGMAKGMWDVIPWTWLLGWFSNFGKYALSVSHSVPAQHSGACFISEVECTYRPRAVRASAGVQKVNLTPAGLFRNTIKTRSVSGALTAGFNMPLLDMFRTSIAGALVTQRILR